MTQEIIEPVKIQFTPEQIKKIYESALDSVAVIMDGKPDDFSDSQWEDRLFRNKEHLKVMLAKDFWTNEDLTSFETAINHEG